MDQMVLKLYITGHTARSDRALCSLKEMCEKHCTRPFRIFVIDVLEQPDLAEKDHILATPTVIREQPGPIRRIIGDLSEAETIIPFLKVD